MQYIITENRSGLHQHIPGNPVAGEEGDRDAPRDGRSDPRLLRAPVQEVHEAPRCTISPPHNIFKYSSLYARS